MVLTPFSFQRTTDKPTGASVNIFYLDPDPVVAASYMHNRHVVKMILESAQMLSAMVRRSSLQVSSDVKLYKDTHVNHPSSVWVRSSFSNAAWLVRHSDRLGNIYYGTYSRLHKSHELIVTIRNCFLYPYEHPEQPPQCMPDCYKSDKSAVIGYRQYYAATKLIDAKGKPNRFRNGYNPWIENDELRQYVPKDILEKLLSWGS